LFGDLLGRAISSRVSRVENAPSQRGSARKTLQPETIGTTAREQPKLSAALVRPVDCRAGLGSPDSLGCPGSLGSPDFRDSLDCQGWPDFLGCRDYRDYPDFPDCQDSLGSPDCPDFLGCRDFLGSPDCPDFLGCRDFLGYLDSPDYSDFRNFPNSEISAPPDREAIQSFPTTQMAVTAAALGCLVSRPAMREAIPLPDVHHELVE
jgi:hypothetical protein